MLNMHSMVALNCNIVDYFRIVAVLVWLPVIADQFATLVATGEGSDLTLCQILDASFDAPEDVRNTDEFQQNNMFVFLNCGEEMCNKLT